MFKIYYWNDFHGYKSFAGFTHDNEPIWVIEDYRAKTYTTKPINEYIHIFNKDVHELDVFTHIGISELIDGDWVDYAEDLIGDMVADFMLDNIYEV